MKTKLIGLGALATIVLLTFLVAATLPFTPQLVGDAGGLTNHLPTIVTVSSVANEPNARQLAAGANITLVDGGGGSTLTISASSGAAQLWGTNSADSSITNINGGTTPVKVFSGGISIPGETNSSQSLFNPSIAAGGSSVSLDLTNVLAASAGNQAYSPLLRLSGNGWKTTATAASQPVSYTLGAVPIQGAANPTSMFVISNQINGGALSDVFNVSSSGNVTLNGSGGSLTAGGDLTSGSGGHVYTKHFASPTNAKGDFTSGGGFSGAGNDVAWTWLNVAQSETSSGINGFMQLNATFSPPSGTPTNILLDLEPVINWGGTPGAGHYEALRINVTETALPTGTNYFMRLGSGGNFKFDVVNNGELRAAGVVTATNGFYSVRSVATGLTSITFPATTANWTNTQTFNIVLYIDNTAITGTAIKKNGTTIFSGLANDTTLLLKPGDYFSETYTVGTPVGNWEPL